ncbi:MAG: ABC transporter permease subunit [Gemmataceae bacterium]
MAILACLAVLGAVLLRIRAKSPWLGPLFVYELVRLARRGSQPRLRAVFSALLLIGLLVIYLRVFNDRNPVDLLFSSNLQLPQEERSNFTEYFTFVYLLVQLIAVSLITPVYAGGAIAEEKDRKSLDFLQSSLLSNREIVLGKLAARLLFVSCIIMVGLPVLFMTMLFGGLDENTIFAGEFLTIFTMLGLAGLSLLMGVYRKTLRDALYWPYGFLTATTVLGFCCGMCIPGVGAVSPFTALTTIFFNNAGGGVTLGTIWGLSPGMYIAVQLGIFATIYGLMFVICTALAIHAIRPAVIEPRIDPDTGRRKSPRPAPRAKVISSEKVNDVPIIIPDVRETRGDPYERPAPRRPRTVKSRRSFVVKPLRDHDPFLWKERYFSGRLPVLESGVVWGFSLTVIVTFLGVLGVGLVAGVLVEVLKGNLPGEVVKYCMRLFCAATILVLAPVVGVRACSSIARERSQQTLLSLLSVPEARERILWAKWLAPLYSVRYWLIALGVAILATLFSGGLHPLGAIAALSYLIGFVPFANSYGLWLSVRSKTGTRATTIFLCTMLTMLIGPPIVGTLFRAILQAITDSNWGLLAENFLDNLNPIVGVWRAFASWEDVSGSESLGTIAMSSDKRAIPALLADTIIGFMYLVAALGFGWFAKKNFEKETE